VAEVWNLSGGRLGRKIAGIAVLEMVSLGHRSGRERQILITYVEDPAGPLIVGTNAVRKRDPVWVENLRTNRHARARWAGRWHEVIAVEFERDDHAAAWAMAVACNDGYAEYAADLTRHVPIIRLEPR
jgi:deazaflavin-dependent oxidoreductase (nitroreductase family)